MNEQDSEVPTTDDADNPAPPQVPLIRWPIYRGWWIALAGAGIVTLTTYANSDIANYVFEPVGSGGSSAAVPVAIGTAASLLLLLPFRPLVGHFVDRRGPLVPVSAALLIGGLTYVVLAIIGPSWPSYSAAILVGAVMAATAPHRFDDDGCSSVFQAPGQGDCRCTNRYPSKHTSAKHFYQRYLRACWIGDKLRLRVLPVALVAFAGSILFIAGLAFLYAMRRWPLWDRQGWQRGTMVLDAPTPSPGDKLTWILVWSPRICASERS